MALRLDHANPAVPDPDRTIRFLQIAFPDFRIRAERTGWLGARRVHVGTDDVYVALHQAVEPAPEPWVPYGAMPGTNHLGFEVDDADDNGREFVQYLSDDPAQRNDYALPDLS